MAKMQGIQIRDAQVIEIDPVKRSMKLIINVNSTLEDVMLPSVKLEAAQKLRAAYKYLIDEQFISPRPISDWEIFVTANPLKS